MVLSGPSRPVALSTDLFPFLASVLAVELPVEKLYVVTYVHVLVYQGAYLPTHQLVCIQALTNSVPAVPFS